MCLTAIVDWHSRCVFAWEMDPSLEVSFVLETVQSAFCKARLKNLNSDQGSQFTSQAYIALLEPRERPHQSLGYQTPADVSLGSGSEHHR